MSLAAISWDDIERVLKFVAAIIAVVAFILFLAQQRRSRKLSAYALPDRVPVWDGNELPSWHASCMYAGTLFVTARAWPFRVLSARGHSFEKRGKGAPSNFIRIVWGRRDLPIVSEFQVSKEVEVTEAWAKEIGRRAKTWKDGNRRSA